MRMRPRVSSFVWAFLLLVVTSATPAVAQLTTGTIRGTAKDETGGVLPGADITITNADTGTTRSLTTNEQGRFEAVGSSRRRNAGCQSISRGLVAQRFARARVQTARDGVELRLCIGREVRAHGKVLA